jgi:hypothetical protein
MVLLLIHYTLPPFISTDSDASLCVTLKTSDCGCETDSQIESDQTVSAQYHLAMASATERRNTAIGPRLGKDRRSRLHQLLAAWKLPLYNLARGETMFWEPTQLGDLGENGSDHSSTR